MITNADNAKETHPPYPKERPSKGIGENKETSHGVMHNPARQTLENTKAKTRLKTLWPPKAHETPESRKH